MKDTRVYPSLLYIAQRNGLAVIEDAAEAIGSTYHAKKAGSAWSADNNDDDSTPIASAHMSV